METVRDIMKTRLKDAFLEFIRKGRFDHHQEGTINSFIAEIADEAFSVCGIPEKEQNEEW